MPHVAPADHYCPVCGTYVMDREARRPCPFADDADHRDHPEPQEAPADESAGASESVTSSVS